MIVVVGAGPAGLFAAITAREAAPGRPVVVFEKAGKPLAKVLVSGGGRCNVTHACFDPRELVTRYPRGGRELRGPLTRFGPAETAAWFAAHGVALKTEADGRMFPTTDDSRTVAEALLGAARDLGVDLRLREGVRAVSMTEGGFRVEPEAGEPIVADKVLLATGGRTSRGEAGSVDGYTLAAALGHAVVPPVPSLFSLDCAEPWLTALAGVAVADAVVAVGEGRAAVSRRGPVLVTHRGVSGPAVLVLSAWAARTLHEAGYVAELRVDWLPGTPASGIDALLKEWAHAHGKQEVVALGPGGLPKRLWTALATHAGVDAQQRWGDLDRAGREKLGAALRDTRLRTTGQSTHKEEFVTCGGVDLREVDFRTMESRRCPGLYLAGEVLDIDGVTGGFNFQGCWTTGRLAGLALAAD
ncbi:MAG: NAD(P)/FAD-dependent oxidoreductase [bacterium]|nr:NAD(P)/FAD-dependent oxidoreductase [bacterium]